METTQEANSRGCDLSPGTVVLEKIGRGGANASRDFWRQAGLPVEPCLELKGFLTTVIIVRAQPQEIVDVETEVDLTEEGSGVTMSHVPVICMLSLIQYLFGSHGLHIHPDKVSQYWKHVREFVPWGASHPATSDQHVPIALYGDEARYTDQAGLVEKVVLLSCNFPLWRPATSRNSRFMLFAIRQSLTTGYNSLYYIYEYISWALNILFFGYKPTVGFPGVRLPASVKGATAQEPLVVCQRSGQPLRFALTEIRGDWSWHCHALNLSNRWTSTSCCFKCWAKSGGRDPNLTYTDYSDNPGWMSQKLTHVQFLNRMTKPGPLCG